MKTIMAIDLSKIAKKYAGLWVGFKRNTRIVVASGRTVRDVLNKAQKKGIGDPVLFRVPTKIIPYVGWVK